MTFGWLVALVGLGGFAADAKTNSLSQPFTQSYSRLDHAACVSLFHRYGRVGCGTVDRSVQTGLLKYIDADNANLPDTNQPYVAVIEDYMLKADIINLFEDEIGIGTIQGVLVLNATSSSGSRKSKQNSDSGSTSGYTYYSPDSQYPQGYGTPSQYLTYGNYKYPWNAKGEDLLQYDLHGLPMAYVKDSDVASVLRNEAQDDSSDSDIVAEFNYYMGPAQMTSPDCLAWRDVGDNEWSPKCLPLGGTSVWASAGPPPGPNQNGQSSNGNAVKPVVLVATGIDATGFFHDLVPAADAVAANVLTLLMAAKLIGTYVDDNTLSGLSNQIVFGFFQGESHGFIGSRAFLNDVLNFQCYSDLVRAVPRHGEKSEYACLNPLRPSLQFSNLGDIVGMLSVDQIGVATTDNLLYVHADQNNDNYGSFLAKVLKNVGTDSFKVVSSSAGNNGDNNGFPYPPSPLTSLLSLTGGAAGGAVLTGYDYAFSSANPYHSHRDSALVHSMSLEAIAGAATMVARTALAAAYDNGDYDYENAAAYGYNMIPELSYNDGTLKNLANCLFYDGECKLIRDYAGVRANNERLRTGFQVGSGASLGNPPNYYVGVYNAMYGQPFVQVGEKSYGRYSGNQFGSSKSDAIGMQPVALENAIHGLLDHFLGRSSADYVKKSCKKQSDCNSVDFCLYGALPTCTGGGVCVCSRAYFHPALDLGFVPAENFGTGYFNLDQNADGLSPMWTEPYWSPSVGVRVYRDVGPIPGLVTLAAGGVVLAASLCAAFVLRVGLTKEKLY